MRLRYSACDPTCIGARMNVIVLACLLSVSGLADVASADCDCRESLAQVVAKVEAEYPGFGAYTRDTLAYTSFKEALLVAADTTIDQDCIRLLKQYANYFRHGHLSVVKLTESSTPAAAGMVDTVDVDLARYLDQPRESKEAFAGIWSSPNYRVGVLGLSGDHVAFIIDSKNENWRSKEVKFRVHPNGEAVYYLGDHTQEPDSCIIVDDSILYFPQHEVVFVREVPPPRLSAKLLADRLAELEGFFLKSVSEKTLLLRISSFDYAYIDRITKLIDDNQIMLASYENLIIDLRGNGGGTDYSYMPLLPLLYTNPVRHLSGEYFVTQTLINSLSDWAAHADPEKYDDIDEVRADLVRMRGQLGQFIPYTVGPAFGYATQDSVLARPGNVAILMDGKCGSSTEKFILDAKQSKKVKTFGTSTYGSVDYLSVIQFNIDCPGYIVNMPTIRDSRSAEYPLDIIGIQPDIYLDKYVEDWVSYAKEYLEAN